MKDGWVLLLEDDANLRETVADGLRRSGFVVRCAKDGAQALKMFEEHQVPAVVLSDLMVPGVLGTSVIEYMKGQDELRDIPVAIVTGSPERAPTGFPVFTKPAPLSDLLEFVQTAMR